MNNPYTQMFYPRQMETTMQPKQVIVVEPYVYAAVSSLVGKRAVVETSRGSVSGTVLDAKLDHIAIQEAESTFFIRLCEIVWIMPE
ncbi:DUF2642 domain-containing protein [Cytobacillus gottheilii]|nr:DUF2642 domain-containing protein [Cytobacillus gottheilii]